MRHILAVSGALFLCSCAANSPKPAADWHAYQAETAKALDAADFRGALQPAQQELAAAEKALPADSPDLAVTLMDLANVERETGAYKDAAAHYQRALSIRNKAFGPGSAQEAETLSGLARNDYLQADVPTANVHFKMALAIQEKTLPEDDPALAETLTYYGRSLADYNQMDDAKALLDRALALREKHPGPGQLDLARTLDQIGFFTILNGDDDGASKLLQRALAILDVPGQSPRPELAYTLDLLGNVDLDLSHFPDAELKFRRALDIMTQVYGPDHQEVANVLNDIARTYDDEGRYAEAEDYYKQSIATYTRALGADNLNVASVTGSLAQMQDNTGEYQQAEANFKRAIQIDGSNWTRDRINMAFDLNNYAQLYRVLGQNEQAESLLRQALAIFQRLLPPDHTYILTVLNNIGELYTEEEKYQESEPYFKQVIAIGEKSLNPDDPTLATWYNNLAEAYEGEHKYADAEALYRKAYAINLKTLGPEHPMTAQYSQNLANLLGIESKFPEAEARYPSALGIFKKTYGPRHTDVADLEFDWAAERFHAGDRRGASPLFDDYFFIMHTFFLDQYQYMNERDRLQLLARSKDSFPMYFSFCLRYHAEDPSLAAKMYDILLWQKGLVGNSIAALRAKIAASGDAEAVSLLGQLSDLKTRLAQLLDNPGSDHAQWQAQVSQLQTQTDATEQQLLARSRSLTQEKSLEKVTWRDVQKTLKPGEAAVEFAHFDYLNGDGHTRTGYYVALVVTPETRIAPKFIVIGKSADLEAGAVADYAGRLSKFGATISAKSTFYRAFWKPLEPALKGATRVYLSPDGILNQASLGIVPDDQGRLLMERYDLRIVPSTRDVLRASPMTAADSAVLLGGPDFDLKPERYLDSLAQLNNSVSGDAEVRYAAIRGSALPVARDLSVGGHCPLPDSGILCPLPGAADEVSGIDELLTRKQWQASLYQGDQALEEAIQAVHHPRLLHIATHGFFLPDQKSVKQDPMLRSGLYFAGADNTLAGNAPPEGADNGVLTAYEAEQLDLEGTELVVLSACDTGLGSAQNGEGVFGLNRALQEAGAQAVVMSMWSVPDQETRELMQLFYANWLGGVEKHEALRQAELKEREVVKQRYGHDLPYYWGAFVMVGR